MKDSLLDLVGGRPALEKIHQAFYDRVFADPWLSPFFAGAKQKHLESQQTDFIIRTLGGGLVFSGQRPENCHMHMFITQEVFDHRQSLMREAILECGVAEDVAEQLLRHQDSFAHAIVKKNISECTKRFHDEDVIQVPKPPNM
ncbi:MAG: group 1 truncated hemoglobin [Nitrospinae bacterium]|nr:group 1 truncated hemoglobin [Nitrospinota bacterium]